MKKERLDILLVKNGLAETREKGKRIIMAGLVIVNDVREDKPGVKFPEDVRIRVKGNLHPYVSRGGLKIEKAYKEFNLDLEKKSTIDVGASTGGFTDFMLQNGAKNVVAIDVGYGQLAWKLRSSDLVKVLERTNIRYVTTDDIGGYKRDFASIDVSFISLEKVLPAVKELLNETGEIIALIKPQFEAGREQVGKNGVVRDLNIHKQVIEKIIKFCNGNSLDCRELTYSPITGPEGNIEYLLYIKKCQESLEIRDFKELIEEVVNNANIELRK